MEEKQPEQDIFSDNIAIRIKKKTKRPLVKPYNITRIKARNFLTNISYNAATEDDSFNKNFVFDVYVLLSENLNSFFISIQKQNTKK